MRRASRSQSASPDPTAPLDPAGLTDGLPPRRLAYAIHYRHTVDSTNSWARALAAEDAPEGTVTLAEEQTAGRGRRGHSWRSLPGGLSFSLVLRPALPAAVLPRLPLMAAVAVAEGVAGACGLRLGIKWPNDLLLDGRKVCGILCELAADGSVVLGIGINVHGEPSAFDDLPGAGALAAASGEPPDRSRLLRALLERFDHWYDQIGNGGWPALLDRWRDISVTIGREVTVRGSFGTASGTAAGVAEDGALLVRGPGGRIRRFLAGEVTLGGDKP